MKTELSYLPQHKQIELTKIKSEILGSNTSIEMIILFGSYARNDWVEVKYDDGSFRYQSDMDIFVVVETRSESAQDKLERELECLLDQEPTINTPVSIIVHDIDFFNKKLRKAQYFFTDIKKEGVLLFDSEKYKLEESRELSPSEREKLAQGDFDYYFKEAMSFKKIIDFCIKENELNKAAFLLHQMTERLYTAILLVFTRYKPNSHSLVLLRKLTNSLDNKLIPIFPLDTYENRRLFKLLCKAYVDARYKPSYKITKDELMVLINAVDELQNIGRKICQEKIKSFQN